MDPRGDTPQLRGKRRKRCRSVHARPSKTLEGTARSDSTARSQGYNILEYGSHPEIRALDVGGYHSEQGHGLRADYDAGGHSWNGGGRERLHPLEHAADPDLRALYGR